MPRRKTQRKEHAQLHPPLARLYASRVQLHRHKRLSDRWPDFLTTRFGTIWFFNVNALFFVGWIVVNLGLIPGIPPFDAYPFGMLTMVVSLEAIFLSIIVLISQNRAARIADLREEVDFQVNVQAEREITEIIRMLDGIQHNLGIEHDNPDSKWMQSELDLRELERRIEREIAG